MCIRDRKTAEETRKAAAFAARHPAGILIAVAALLLFIMTVSYTHLDVYKRQFRTRSASVSAERGNSSFGQFPTVSCCLHIHIAHKRPLRSYYICLLYTSVPMITRKFGILSVSEVCPAPMLQ